MIYYIFYIYIDLLHNCLLSVIIIVFIKRLFVEKKINEIKRFLCCWSLWVLEKFRKYIGHFFPYWDCGAVGFHLGLRIIPTPKKTTNFPPPLEQYFSFRKRWIQKIDFSRASTHQAAWLVIKGVMGSILHQFTPKLSYDKQIQKLHSGVQLLAYSSACSKFDPFLTHFVRK